MLWTELYLLLAIFAVMILAMLWAGIEGFKQARLLRLRWVGYGQAIGWLTVGLFEVVVFILAVYKLYSEGLPPEYKGVEWQTWAGLGLWLVFTLFIAVTTHLSVRNLRRMKAEQRSDFSKLKREMQRLKSNVGDG